LAGSPKKRARREAAARAAADAAAAIVDTIAERDALPSIREERRPGPPAAYSDEIGERLCADLAHGMTLREVCRQVGMPAPTTVIGWALDEKHPFYGKYEQARLIGYTIMADDIITIADEPAADQTAVGRTRNRIESRKWVLAKALPKIFGDKIEHVGKDGAPLFPEVIITYGSTTVVNHISAPENPASEDT
jgi:hypothetical protein